MDEFVIEGRALLRGEVTPSGNKNAAFPLIAAALLTDQPVCLGNLPDIEDVRTMLQIVEGLGARVDRLDAHTITIEAKQLSTDTPDPRLLRRIRGALVLIGPLLARWGSPARTSSWRRRASPRQRTSCWPPCWPAARR
jgi:UDP-N-acetylglucosamine 1-carboxyvinyltransferase